MEIPKIWLRFFSNIPDELYFFAVFFSKDVEQKMLNICKKIIQYLVRSMKSKLNKRRGFTIVEVLIAVAIMAILITAVMNGISGAKKEAREKIWQTEVNTEAFHAVGLIEDYLSSHQGSTPGDAAAAPAVTGKLRKDPTGNTYTLTATSGGEVTLTPSGAVTNAGVKPGTGKTWD